MKVIFLPHFHIGLKYVEIEAVRTGESQMELVLQKQGGASARHDILKIF